MATVIRLYKFNVVILTNYGHYFDLLLSHFSLHQWLSPFDLCIVDRIFQCFDMSLFGLVSSGSAFSNDNNYI